MADGNHNEHPISVGILLGAGTTFDKNLGGVNPFGFGFGVRGGYNFGKSFFGLRFIDYVGSSVAIPTGMLSMSSWLLAAEAGCDIDISMFVLQPTIALGITSRSVDGPPLLSGSSGFVPGAGDATHTGLYLAPGASLVLPLFDMFFVGADARLGFIIGNEFSGDFELLATGGARF